MTLKGSKIYRFNLFGYRFFIWRKDKDRYVQGKGVGRNGSCKIVRHNEHIGLAMPDGTIIPNQLDLDIKAPLNALVTAKVELYVTLDELKAE